MILKSFLILSVITSALHLPVSSFFDNALVKNETGSSNIVSADFRNLELPIPIITPEVKKNAKSPRINAYRYLLGDVETGVVFAKEDHFLQVPIASTTKIMTALVVLENYELDDVITISPAAAYQPGADAFLRVDEQISVESLIYCLLLKSGNDSAYALAEHMNDESDIGIGKFVEAMNKKAKELGMKNTKYADPAGLDTEGYSTAYDLFTLTRYALNNKKFASIVRLKEAVVRSKDNKTQHILKNSNRLVGEYDYVGAIGVKTGYMPEAGHTLVSAVKRDGHTLIGVVLYTYADTAQASADESRKLMDWGWQNIEW